MKKKSQDFSKSLEKLVSIIVTRQKISREISVQVIYCESHQRLEFQVQRYFSTKLDIIAETSVVSIVIRAENSSHRLVK